MTWSIEKGAARFQGNGWKLQGDLSLLRKGLVLSYERGSTDVTVDASLFAVDVEPPLESVSDGYCREGDLIATFAQTADRPFALQLDYRVVACDSKTMVVEVWASVQTSWLDSHPVIAFDFKSLVGSHRVHRVTAGMEGLHEVGIIDDLPAVDDLTGHIEDAAVAIGEQQAKGTPVYFAILLHPLDQADASWSRATHGNPLKHKHDGLRIALFGDFMEKGVIRRARLRYVASLDPLGEDRILSLYREFEASPLPLDT